MLQKDQNIENYLFSNTVLVVVRNPFITIHGIRCFANIIPHCGPHGARSHDFFANLMQKSLKYIEEYTTKMFPYLIVAHKAIFSGERTLESPLLSIVSRRLHLLNLAHDRLLEQKSSPVHRNPEDNFSSRRSQLLQILNC
jgi:hypothetical protein